MNKYQVKKFFIKLIPNVFLKFIEFETFRTHKYYKYLNISFSQDGEDLILSQLFYGVSDGLFVDIGAHHPIHFSNTYKFYLLGWRGLNIDAMPGSMKEFDLIRPEDINLEIGISNDSKSLNFFIFEQSKVNTFSEQMANEHLNNGGCLLSNVKVPTERIDRILEKNLKENTKIDFLSLDVEGLEFEVLTSNDWVKYRPKVILVESLKMKNKILFDDFFETVQYVLIAQTVNNLFYVDMTSDILPIK